VKKKITHFEFTGVVGRGEFGHDLFCKAVEQTNIRL
jgi:hypothetical protein